MKRGPVSLLICALIISGSLNVVFGLPYVRRVLSSMRADAKETEQDETERTTNVKVRKLKATTVQDRLVLTGSAYPWEDITISAETSGRIEWQGVEEGDVAEAGRELIKVDTTAVRARLDEIRAQHRLAEQELERIRGLSKGGISSPQELDRALANRDVVAANLRTMEIQLAKSTVTAQIGGVVDKLFKEQGEFADVGTALVRLVQTGKVKIIVGVPERDVAFFSPGDPVAVTFDALPGREFEGAIFRIATTADLSTRTFATEIEMDNAAGLLKPGMIARATLVRASYPDSIAIPFFTAITLDDKHFVFVAEDGLARVRPIDVGVFQGGDVQVTRGLSAGDRLIVVGQRDLRDGEPVQVQEVLE